MGDNLEVARNLLNLQGSVAMIMKAKQQLMALLLNVAAGPDLADPGDQRRTARRCREAITVRDNLIDNPSGDYSKAITICDRINNGQQVQAGMIPLSTQNIEYAQFGRQAGLQRQPPDALASLDFHSLAARAPVRWS